MQPHTFRTISKGGSQGVSRPAKAGDKIRVYLSEKWEQLSSAPSRVSVHRRPVVVVGGRGSGIHCNYLTAAISSRSMRWKIVGWDVRM